MARSFQRLFCPVDYNFSWTADGTPMGWYTWERKAAQSAALKARNAEAKALRAQGYTVRVFSLPDQRITRGGIGSGHPEVDFIATGYGFNAEGGVW
ncbi:MAG: hypothetical protein A2Y38_19515 [Spirochaetes bacterium GWB1_59_5]|nr:MAG: hypothetical protein A2Y38_19515 [Spirochaetes bacterium GWB1_59_5]